jgi:hypothetical protein
MSEIRIVNHGVDTLVINVYYINNGRPIRRDIDETLALQLDEWNGSATAKPRQVSVLLHPLQVDPAPLLWQDGSRREHRRACMHLVRHQRVEVRLPPIPPPAASPGNAGVIFSRAQRAHTRLWWETRLARNARRDTSGQVTIKLFGIPNDFARDLGLTGG